MGSAKTAALIFPGQGAQYVGMGAKFFESFQCVREAFEEGDDLLGRGLSQIMLKGPESELTETKNSQPALFIACSAALRAIKESFPSLKAAYAAGLSLGEYSAIAAAEMLTFSEALKLVDKRSRFMNDACEAKAGTMAVILGLAAEEVEELVAGANLPNDLWAANFNCPGQVVISGTKKGVEIGRELALKKGAKRVLPLSVHGAFHSGLMRQAEERLTPYIESAPIEKGAVKLVMNVTATAVEEPAAIKRNLALQVTHPVRWEESVREMMRRGVDLFIEIGCGKTLSGFNRKIGVTAPTIGVETPEELERLAELLA